MKLKYILGMIAGLVTLTATSCNKNTTADAEAGASSAVATADTATEEAAGAYYVMFKGDGS